MHLSGDSYILRNLIFCYKKRVCQFLSSIIVIRSDMSTLVSTRQRIDVTSPHTCKCLTGKTLIDIWNRTTSFDNLTMTKLSRNLINIIGSLCCLVILSTCQKKINNYWVAKIVIYMYLFYLFFWHLNKWQVDMNIWQVDGKSWQNNVNMTLSSYKWWQNCVTIYVCK